MLYLTKYIVVTAVVGTAKYWFIITTKVRKEVAENWPKVHAVFKRKPKSPTAKPSFVKRSVVESKIRIRRVKERVKRDHGQSVTEVPETKEEEHMN